MTTHPITIEIDDAKLGTYTDEHLAVCWHAAQHNPAGHVMIRDGAQHGKEGLEVGSPCPGGCIKGVPGREVPETLTANEDGELSCPRCWDNFGFIRGGAL